MLLARALHASENLQRIYDAAFAASCGEPWRLVVAFDEFTPGSLHKPQNLRNAMVLAHSFLDLGQSALCQELTWMLPIVVRCSKIKNVQGGWSHMLKLFLRRLLFGPHGLCTAGVALTTKQGGETITVCLTAQLWALLGDGDGSRSCFNWKVANGLKPCVQTR